MEADRRYEEFSKVGNVNPKQTVLPVSVQQPLKHNLVFTTSAIKSERNEYTHYWTSSECCAWPQELYFEIDAPTSVSICEIQLVAHECKTPTIIEFLIGDRKRGQEYQSVSELEPGTELSLGINTDIRRQMNWRSIGYVKFSTPSENLEDLFREMKTIDVRQLESNLFPGKNVSQLGVSAKFVKLLIHGCHFGPFNPQRQASLVSVSFIGKQFELPAQVQYDSEHVFLSKLNLSVKTKEFESVNLNHPGSPMKSDVDLALLSLGISPALSSTAQINSSRLEETSGQQGVPNMMFGFCTKQVDSDTMYLLDKLESFCETKHKEEKYGVVARVKESIAELRVLGQKIVGVENHKRESLEKEDYVAAKADKEEVQRLILKRNQIKSLYVKDLEKYSEAVQYTPQVLLAPKESPTSKKESNPKSNKFRALVKSTPVLLRRGSRRPKPKVAESTPATPSPAQPEHKGEDPVNKSVANDKSGPLDSPQKMSQPVEKPEVLGEQMEHTRETAEVPPVEKDSQVLTSNETPTDGRHAESVETDTEVQPTQGTLVPRLTSPGVRPRDYLRCRILHAAETNGNGTVLETIQNQLRDHGDAGTQFNQTVEEIFGWSLCVIVNSTEWKTKRLAFQVVEASLLDLQRFHEHRKLYQAVCIVLRHGLQEKGPSPGAISALLHLLVAVHFANETGDDFCSAQLKAEILKRDIEWAVSYIVELIHSTENELTREVALDALVILASQIHVGPSTILKLLQPDPVKDKETTTTEETNTTEGNAVTTYSYAQILFYARFVRQYGLNKNATGFSLLDHRLPQSAVIDVAQSALVSLHLGYVTDGQMQRMETAAIDLFCAIAQVAGKSVVQPYLAELEGWQRAEVDGLLASIPDIVENYEVWDLALRDATAEDQEPFIPLYLKESVLNAKEIPYPVDPSLSFSRRRVSTTKQQQAKSRALSNTKRKLKRNSVAPVPTYTAHMKKLNLSKVQPADNSHETQKGSTRSDVQEKNDSSRKSKGPLSFLKNALTPRRTSPRTPRHEKPQDSDPDNKDATPPTDASPSKEETTNESIQRKEAMAKRGVDHSLKHSNVSVKHQKQSTSNESEIKVESPRVKESARASTSSNSGTAQGSSRKESNHNTAKTRESDTLSNSHNNSGKAKSTQKIEVQSEKLSATKPTSTKKPQDEKVTTNDETKKADMNPKDKNENVKDDRSTAALSSKQLEDHSNKASKKKKKKKRWGFW